MHRHAFVPAEQTPAPSRVGRFYLMRELGRGATGCVYLGHDPVVGRNVAIKVLNPRIPAAEQARHTRHLINEARAAGRLCHPHIVTVHDASNEGETPFLAMEYLQGRGLDRLLAEGRRFKVEEVASIGWKLADALDHAHRSEVVHRDIKPSNIFILQDDQPKLMDFGIARAPNRIVETEDDADNQYTMYRPNQPLGTPNYMSPEQAQGRPADERSDIYSLGAVLYEMLAGRTPFKADDPDVLLEQIAHKAAPPLHEVNPEAPPMLVQVVMKAMSKRPEKRYQDAREMALDLKRYLLAERRDRRRRASSAPQTEAVPRPALAPSPAASALSKGFWTLAFAGAVIAGLYLTIAH